MRLILGTLFLCVLSAAPSFADIHICNRTNSELQLIIASRVEVPYETKEIAGWHTIKPGTCKTPLTGDFTGESFYYYISYSSGARTWSTEGKTSTYRFCVQQKAFVRRGTYNKLQNDCPSGWYTREFYEEPVTATDFTLNLYD
jgi:uncharacterized membrane protein